MFKLLRYGSVTLISQLVLFLGTLVAVEVLGFAPDISYAVVLTLVYIGVYFASSHFVFKATEHIQQSVRYTIAVIAFWGLNILVFNLLLNVFDWQYLLAVLFNIFALGLLRYFVYNRLVFAKQNDQAH
jgi:putative flippase GtrA